MVGGEKEWPWIARFALELGSHDRDAVEAALAKQAACPSSPVSDFLTFDAEAHTSVVDRLKDRPLELVREVEGRAFLRWALESGVLAGKATERALALAAEQPRHRLWELLRDEGTITLDQLPDFGDQPFRCPACRIRLDVPTRLVEFIEQCPACGVRRPRLSVRPPPEGADETASQDWLIEETLARWAIARAGASVAVVEEARRDERPVWDALVLSGALRLEDTMEAMGCEVSVLCTGCGIGFSLGAELSDFVGDVACPTCQGELESQKSGTGASVEDREQTSISRRVGPYRLLHRIGGGQMSDVYLATGEGGKPIAVKLATGFLSGDARRRFEREGKMLEALEHPNVVRVLGHGVDPASERPYLAMELVSGRNLGSLLRDRAEGRLTTNEAALVLERCARALAHAHERGVVHRDVKPDNVLLSPDGEVKLTDFGISLSDKVSARLTGHDELIGTPHFLAPETLDGGEWGPAADLYALGATAFLLSAGRHVFPSDDRENLLAAHLEQEPERLVDLVPGVPAVFSELVAELLAKDPGQRPSAITVAERLAEHVPREEELAILWAEANEPEEQTAGAVRLGEATLTRGQTFQHFRIERRIGRGGMGIVYQAYHRRLKRMVALKVLVADRIGSADARRRFLREAEAAGALHHPYVVPVLDAGEHEGVYFITMELVEGDPLHKWDKQTAELDAKLEVFGKICEGVHHAHSRGIIHRDLKPDNILVDLDQDPHILDFGIAKRIDEGSEEGETVAALTTEGDVLGTLRYMAPEQAAGRNDEVDIRSDVYALGSMLYMQVAGRTPFVGSSAEVLHRLHFEDPRPPSAHKPDIPWELDAICLKALERQRDDRYQSALELRQDLERFRAGRPIRARQANLGYRFKKFVLRHRRQVAAVAAVLLTALTLGGAWAYQDGLRERKRVAGIIDSTLDGWRQYGQRQYVEAGKSFDRALRDLRRDEFLHLPPGQVGVLPQVVLARLDPEERQRPLVHRDRLKDWAELVEKRRKYEQATEWIQKAREALAKRALAEATEAVRIALRLALEDADARSLATRIADALVTQGRAQVEGSKALEDFAAKEAALTNGLASFDQARKLDQGNERATQGTIETKEALARLKVERKNHERVSEARSKLASALKHLARGRSELQAGKLPAAERRLRRARLDLAGARERWPELSGVKLAATEVALALGWLWLRAVKVELAEQELGMAMVSGLLPARVAKLSKAVQAQDRTLRAFRKLVDEADAFLAQRAYARALTRYGLALDKKPDREVARKKNLCLALVAAQAARATGDLKGERTALVRARAFHKDPRQLGRRLTQLDAALYDSALQEADAAFLSAEKRGGGWKRVIARYDAALAYRPRGPLALRGRADAFATWKRPAGMVLVSIPRKLLVRGALAARIGAEAALRYYVDRYEVSNARFAAFVAAGGYGQRRLWSRQGWRQRFRFRDTTGRHGPAAWVDGKPSPGTADLPVTGVSFYEAEAYAAWRKRRLPTEEEWRLAACFSLASGGFQRFPWGERSPRLTKRAELRPVGASRSDQSPWLVFDMGLNASEWVRRSTRNRRIAAVRGLCSLTVRLYPRDLERGVLDFRKTPRPSFRDPCIGFRCARDVGRIPAPRPPGGNK